MQQELKNIPSNDLVEMLIKSTEFYMQLCKEAEGDVNNRKLVQTHIDQIIAEMKNREEYKDVLKETDLRDIPPE
jgi:hypothetical protein